MPSFVFGVRRSTSHDRSTILSRVATEEDLIGVETDRSPLTFRAHKNSE